MKIQEYIKKIKELKTSQEIYNLTRQAIKDDELTANEKAGVLSFAAKTKEKLGSKKELVVLVGCPGAGKSTYAKSIESDSVVIVSTDEERRRINGDLIQENLELVLSSVKAKIDEALRNKEVKTIVFDSTHVSRKKRAGLYTLYKDKANVKIVFFAISLKTLFEQNGKREGLAFVPNILIKNKFYKNLQVPRLGVDCDSFEVITNEQELENMRLEYTPNEIVEHDSSYHKESVQQHIQWTIENAEKTGDKQLIEIAKWHDLGKFITKKFVSEDRAMFKCHENVSAFYYLANLPATPTKEQLEVMEVIYQHMNAHRGFSDNQIERNKLTVSELRLLNDFVAIDDMSRIV